MISSMNDFRAEATLSAFFFILLEPYTHNMVDYFPGYPKILYCSASLDFSIALNALAIDKHILRGRSPPKLFLYCCLSKYPITLAKEFFTLGGRPRKRKQSLQRYIHAS
jgi:hypothetical protein